MKILLSFVITANILFGAMIQTTDVLLDFKLKDQFEKKLSITQDTKKLIIAFSKDKGGEIKKYLDANPQYLQNENAIYIADVSAAPSFVTSLFMMPKFKEYPFSMGVVRDEEFAAKLPKQEDMITIIHLENFVVSKIEFRKSLS